MQQIFNQLLQFLQQGITAIFTFVKMIWTWSVGQIASLTQVPWQSWPLWKQLVLAVVVVAVAFALFKVAKELWEAGEKILAAFAALLGVVVRTLPTVIVAGIIAVGGVWILNNADLSSVKFPTFSQSDAGQEDGGRGVVKR